MTADIPARQPQHCETCEHGKKHIQILYPNGEPKTRLVKCEKLNRAITHEESDILSEVGCATHTSPPSPEEMEQRFRTKREAWEQGYQDGGSAVQHDLNLLEQAAAKAAREQYAEALKKMILSKMLPKSSQWEAGMYIQYDDVLSMIQSLQAHQQGGVRG